MNRSNTPVVVLVMLLLGQATNPASADVDYDVVPYTLSDGYAIVGGTITTNDALDTILAWDIEVTGPRGYQFSDTNPGAIVLPDEFDISPTAITISGFFGDSTGFRAFDNTDPDCVNCRQSLIYISSGASISYQFRDDDDADPNVMAEFIYTDFITVATATPVPEPASAAMLAIGAVALLHRRGRDTSTHTKGH